MSSLLNCDYIHIKTGFVKNILVNFCNSSDEGTLFQISLQSLDLPFNPYPLKDEFMRFSGRTQFQLFLKNSLLLLEVKIKPIKFCTKLQVKRVKFLMYKCTGLLLNQNSKIDRIFKKFQRTVHAIMVKVQHIVLHRLYNVNID